MRFNTVRNNTHSFTVLRLPFWLTLVTLLGLPFSALGAVPSALRDRHEDARSRIAATADRVIDDTTAMGASVPLAQLDRSGIPEVSPEQLRTLFLALRDVRAWEWSGQPGMPRRIPWLYAEDGCFLRAQLMIEKLREWHAPTPKQVFAFGDLHAQSRYGDIYWSFHVAPTVRANGQTFVLDPSLEPQRPVTLEEWATRTADSLDTITFAVCGPNSVYPDDSCLSQETFALQGDTEASALQDLLGAEWSTILNAGENPASLLTDHPPW